MVMNSVAKRGTLLALLFVVVTAAAPVSAQDVVRINHGTLVWTVPISSFDLSGTKGFRAEGGFSTLDGFFPCFFEGCPGGTVLDLSASWGGLGIGERARLRGVEYPLGALSDESASVFFFVDAGSITLPPVTEGTVTLSTPFQFTGSFSAPTTGASLTGAGIATVTLGPGDPGTWGIQQVVFEFFPNTRRQ